MTTYTFEPPYVRYAWPTGSRLINRLKLRRGLAVISDGQGGWYSMEFPYQGDLSSLTDGVTYFMGGHVYTVDDALAASLTAAGYTVTGFSGGTGGGGGGTGLAYGDGTYGDGDYGDGVFVPPPAPPTGGGSFGAGGYGSGTYGGTP